MTERTINEILDQTAMITSGGMLESFMREHSQLSAAAREARALLRIAVADPIADARLRMLTTKLLKKWKGDD